MNKIFNIILLMLLLLLATSSVNADNLKETLGTGTTNGALIGEGLCVWSGFNFTTTSSFTLTKADVYITEYQNSFANPEVYARVYSNNAGSPSVQIGSDSNNQSTFVVGQRNNFTFSNNNVVLTTGTTYWILFRGDQPACNGGSGIKIGKTSGSGSGIQMYCDAGVTSCTSYGSVADVNILLWGSGEVVSSQLGYTTPIISGESHTIYFNLTNSTDPPSSDTITQANATLNYYNGSKYQMTLSYSNDTSVGFKYTLNAPIVNSNVVGSFNFTYFLNNVEYNSSNHLQTINTIPLLNITSLPCSNMSYNFTFYDEDNQTILNMTTIDYNFKYGISNSTQITTAGQILNSEHLYVCYNGSVSPTFNLGYSQINYQKTGWVARRWYGFNTSTLSNVVTNISLFDLNNAYATAFQLSTKSSTGIIYSDIFVHSIRYYPDQASYKIVDIGLTDETGNTITYVKTQDVDYRMGLYNRNGTLIKLFDPIRLYCLSSPCTLSLSVNPTTTAYSDLANIQYTFTFNTTTNIWSFVYTDPSFKTTGMNMTIWRDLGATTTTICSSVTTGTTGAITCNTTGYTGTLRGEIYRTASPTIPFLQYFVNIGQNLMGTSRVGLFFGFILSVTIIGFTAMISPIAMVIGIPLGLIVPYYLGVFSWEFFAGAIVLGIIILYWINKRNT